VLNSCAASAGNLTSANPTSNVDFGLCMTTGTNEKRSKAWPPPIMAPLAATAANTSLGRFYPFLSHHLLR
jgi:hypothetical protein